MTYKILKPFQKGLFTGLVKKLLTQEDLRSLLDYSSETGLFTWRVSPTFSVKSGTKAGALKTNGYYQIGIKKKLYLSHRLAWFYVFGEFPIQVIDHINGDKSDNRLVNLREASLSQNGKNSKRFISNSSGYKGVSWDTRRGKWVVQDQTNGKKNFLGYYVKLEEAIKVYKTFAEQAHGEFYRDTTEESNVR